MKRKLIILSLKCFQVFVLYDVASVRQNCIYTETDNKSSILNESSLLRTVWARLVAPVWAGPGVAPPPRGVQSDTKTVRVCGEVGLIF